MPQELFPEQEAESNTKGSSDNGKETISRLHTDHRAYFPSQGYELVTFAVDGVAHSLIVSFPVFVKHY